MIIGITGTNGAGKGTVVDFLVSQKKFHHFSARSFLIQEVKRRGLAIERPNMRIVANELRKVHGPEYVAEQLMAQALQEKEGSSVVESIRTVGEAEYLKSHGAFIWAVDANRQTRYERVLLRQSEIDRVTFEQFCIYEDREMESSEPYDMNVFAVMKMAGHIFYNNGTVEELFSQVENELIQVEKK